MIKCFMKPLYTKSTWLPSSRTQRPESPWKFNQSCLWRATTGRRTPHCSSPYRYSNSNGWRTSVQNKMDISKIKADWFIIGVTLLLYWKTSSLIHRKLNFRKNCAIAWWFWKPAFGYCQWGSSCGIITIEINMNDIVGTLGRSHFMMLVTLLESFVSGCTCPL